jgi:hypothetical protein
LQNAIMKTHAPLILIVSLVATLAQARTWKAADGRTLEAEKWRVDGDRIHFVIQGKELAYEIAKLSAEDQAFVRQSEKKEAALSKAAAPPTAATGKGKPPTKRPNGDVFIENLPEPPIDEDVAYWPATAIATVLNAYYGWKADVVAIAKENKWDPKSDHWEF